MFKLMGKKIIVILRYFFFVLTGPMGTCTSQRVVTIVLARITHIQIIFHKLSFTSESEDKRKS